MAVQVDRQRARRVLEDAVAWAESDRPVPDEWIQWTVAIGQAPSRTFTAALGTALLAKATEASVDPLALKATDDPRAYSARGLGHGVLVPASVEFGFDLGATGREPLNNQPFFRYDRIDEMARVHSGAKEAHDRLVRCLQAVDWLSAPRAQAALAAFLRVRMDVAASAHVLDLRGVRVTVSRTVRAADQFITEEPEEGRRGQALVAAAFDLAFQSVRMGRVHDPSRRFAGDVQALEGAHAILAAEVRQKPVSHEDAIQFAQSLRNAGTGSGVMVALAPNQDPLDRDAVLEQAEERAGVYLSVIEGVGELLGAALTWSGKPLDQSLAELPQRVADRLREIEVSPAGLDRWSELLERT